MYEVKARVFLYFTKRQKASLCTFLKGFVKNNKNLKRDEILYKFLEDEEYYYKIENPHFYFVVEYMENEDFICDLKLFIDAILKDIEYKNAQKPYIEKMKQIEKEKKKVVQENKMKKEKPTSKQLKYYKKLCKFHNIEEKDVTRASRYDLKEWIGEILDGYKEKN